MIAEADDNVYYSGSNPYTAAGWSNGIVIQHGGEHDDNDNNYQGRYAEGGTGGGASSRAMRQGKMGNYRSRATIVQNNTNNRAAKNSGIAMFGEYLQSNAQGQVVLGRFNKPDNDAILIVGGGDASGRRNALSVSIDGSVTIGDKGGGSGMVTTDESGNYIDLFTEKVDKKGEIEVSKVIK